MKALAICAVLVAGLSAPVWAAGSDVIQSAVKNSLASPDRPAEDRARDAARKPEAVLAFAGIEPGMHIFEYSPGGGWYSEILSRYLGDEGHVFAFNDSAFARFYKDAADKRYSADRLQNVTYREDRTDALELEANRFDAALLILAYHDLYFRPPGTDPLPDRLRFLKEIANSLKAGGVLLIIDHVGPSGISPEKSGPTLHRIDPQAVLNEVEKAGFKLDASASFLANPDDPHTVPFWELERGTTDRFVYRFTVK